MVFQMETICKKFRQPRQGIHSLLRIQNTPAFIKVVSLLNWWCSNVRILAEKTPLPAKRLQKQRCEYEELAWQCERSTKPTAKSIVEYFPQGKVAKQTFNNTYITSRSRGDKQLCPFSFINQVSHSQNFVNLHESCIFFYPSACFSCQPGRSCGVVGYSFRMHEANNLLGLHNIDQLDCLCPYVSSHTHARTRAAPSARKKILSTCMFQYVSVIKVWF